VVATCTPAQPVPPTSALVQDAIGLNCGAFDLDTACSGFVYGLITAEAVVTSGRIGAALVIGAETLSRIVDPTDRSTAILFGDGAAAAVLAPSVADAGLLAWDVGCDGSAASLLHVPAGGARLPTSAATVRDRLHYLRLDGSEVFRRAVRVTVASAEATLERAGVTAAYVDLFVPHQANRRIIDAAASRLGIPDERVVCNLDRYGNTSAASIGLALAEAEPKDGDLVLLAGFGAGMTWASALLRWSTND
jgi:3-oxoacyl-[acyl-carrier-protein] synthase-3